MAEPSFEFRAPPFTRAMRVVAVVLGVIWLVTVLLQGAGLGGFTGPLGFFEPLALVPESVVRRGFAWQLVTHALLHDPGGFVSLLFTVLALWFMGSPLEARWGARRVLGLMAGATLVGGACAVGAGFVSAAIFRGAVVSPAAAVSALLAAWCALHAKERVSFLGLATLSGGQMLGLMAGVVLLQFAWTRDGTGVASLAGFPVGYLYASRTAGPRGGVRAQRQSGPHLRVIRGGGSDLPN